MKKIVLLWSVVTGLQAYPITQKYADTSWAKNSQSIPYATPKALQINNSIENAKKIFLDYEKYQAFDNKSPRQITNMIASIPLGKPEIMPDGSRVTYVYMKFQILSPFISREPVILSAISKYTYVQTETGFSQNWDCVPDEDEIKKVLEKNGGQFLDEYYLSHEYQKRILALSGELVVTTITPQVVEATFKQTVITNLLKPGSDEPVKSFLQKGIIKDYLDDSIQLLKKQVESLIGIM